MKKPIIALIAILIAGSGLYYCYFSNQKGGESAQVQIPAVEEQAIIPDEKADTAQVATTSAEVKKEDAGTPVKAPENKGQTVIGKSVEGRDIVANYFGTGEKEILLVGGIHGGYSWNTALLAYELIDYMKINPKAVSIPSGIKLTIIPVLNPDGLAKVISTTGLFKADDVSASKIAMVAGRFNGHNVDLNRNFDCNWKAEGIWQNKTVSGGSVAFSEPESAAIRDYAKDRKIAAVIGWYSAGGGVYSSSCGNGILPETQKITDIFAKASGYTAYKNFESYQVSGDMTDWFAKNNVPAIGVLLTASNNTELNKNLEGIQALFEYYSK